MNIGWSLLLGNQHLANFNQNKETSRVGSGLETTMPLLEPCVPGQQHSHSAVSKPSATCNCQPLPSATVSRCRLQLQRTATCIQLSLLHLPLQVYARAVRNCPWVGSLWAAALRAHERLGGPDDEHEAMAARALAAGMQVRLGNNIHCRLSPCASCGGLTLQ